MPRTAQPHYEAARRQWYIYVDYRKRFLCTGTRHDWIKAAKAAEKLLGHPVTPPGEMLVVGQAVARWLLRNGTDWAHERLKPFVAFAASEPLDGISEDLLIDFLAHLKRTGYTRVYAKRDGSNRRERRYRYSAKSLRTMVGLADGVLKWAASPPRRWINVEIRRPELPVPRKLYRDIPMAKLRAAIENIEQKAKRAAPLIKFILNIGCRPAEACLLRWDQLDLDAGIARIEEHKTDDSTGEDRILYLTPAAIEILEQQPHNSQFVFTSRRGRPYNPKSIRSFMRRRGIARAYDLRHTFAQFELEQGVRLDVIQRHLGHKHISTTQIYAQVRDPQAAEVARNLASPLQPRQVQQVDQPKVDVVDRTDSRGTRTANRRTRKKGHARQATGRRAAGRRRSA